MDIQGPNMRSAIIGSAILAFLMIFAPAASAQVEGSAVLDFRSPSEVVMVLDGKVAGEEAADMREMADSSFTGGNGDGTVSQEEVDAIEAFFSGFFEEMDDNETPTGPFTVDGKQPSSFSLQSVDIRDATGPISSTSPITIHIEFKSLFDVSPADQHTVRIEADEDASSDNFDEEDSEGDFGDIGSLSLKAPSGYIIESTSGLPAGGELSGDRRSITFEEIPEPTGEDVVIVFARSGGAGGAAPGPAFVIGLALVAALVASRRR